MRLAIKILLLLLLPAALFAQDTVSLKKQVNMVANALMDGDYNTLVKHIYPRFLQLSGGKEKVLQMLAKGNDQLKAMGGSVQSVSVGSPGKFYKAGNETHCLIPEYTRVKLGNGSIVNRGNLLAITSNKGKKWYFLDLNRNTIALLPKLFPNFNKELIIPRPASNY